jgi:subtilase family serine protease
VTTEQRRRLTAVLAVGVLLGVGACTNPTAGRTSTPVTSTTQPPSAYKLPAGVVHPAPFSRQFRPAQFEVAPSTAQCEASYAVACYSPHQLQVAYGMEPLYSDHFNGSGETIVIVDCFGSPTIKADLAKFDATFGLPAPPSFQIVAPAGTIPPWDAVTGGPMFGWGVETSLDVEYAHAMAPGASLVLVETPVNETEGTAGFPQIETAEEWAIDHEDPAVISQSFGATEGTFPGAASILGLRGAFSLAQERHVTVLAATGDYGSTEPSDVSGSTLYTRPAVDWPASDPLVTAVGGTQLHLSANGARLQEDNVWNDSNLVGAPLASSGGVSEIFARPTFQDVVKAVTGNHRGVPDVSLSAAEDGGAIVYESFPGTTPAFYIVGGTSAATPLFAGIVAVADQFAGKHLGWLNPSLYALASRHAVGIVDVTVGSNTVTFEQQGRTVTVPGYLASTGYDLASGLGTVNGDALVRELKTAGG